jgi:hypothetical protein
MRHQEQRLRSLESGLAAHLAADQAASGEECVAGFVSCDEGVSWLLSWHAANLTR